MEANTRIVELRKLINHHNHEYYVLGTPTIEDAVYDKLYEELRGLEGKYPELADPHSPTQRVGGISLSSGFAKVAHRTKMLSLDNIRTAAEVLKSFETGEEVLIEPKIDGLSLKLVYKEGKLVQAITRGNGDVGDDVTANARVIKTIPLVLTESIHIEVLGEIYMSYDAFNRLNKALLEQEEEPLANARNAAAGALKLKNPEEVATRRLSFVAYGAHTVIKGVETQATLAETLADLGFQNTYMLPTLRATKPVTMLVTLRDEEQVNGILKELDERRKSLDLQTDGLVFKVNSLHKQQDLGEGNKYPNWGFAFKYPPERKVTTLHHVTIQVGKTGKITPVAELKPVLLSGTVVQRASLCNQDEIERLNVNIGDEVYIEKAAEIIPDVMGVAVKNSEGYYKIPLQCPCCKQRLTNPNEGVDLFCTNPNCKDVVYARMVYAVGKKALDLQGCGKAMVAEFIRNGYKRVSDLLTVKREELTFLKPAAKTKFLEQREAAKTKDFWRQLAALNIEGLGETLSQEVAAKYPSLEALTDNWIKVKEIVGPAVYKTMRFWFANEANADEIDRLCEAGMTFASATANGVLTGKVFVITGTLMSGQRDEVAERIRKAGGIVKNSATRKTNFIVQGIGGGRVKAEAAEKLGIPLISEEQLYEMMGVPMPTVERRDLEAMQDD